MANLEKLAANYRSEGYSALLAEARVWMWHARQALRAEQLSPQREPASIRPSNSKVYLWLTGKKLS